MAVVGAYVTRELFLGEWPIDEVLRVGGVPFTVIGILEGKGVSQDGANEDSQIIIPVSTAQRRLQNVDYLDRIFVQAVSKSAVRTAERDVRALLRRRHGLEPAVEDDFEIQDQDALVAAQAETGGRALGGTGILLGEGLSGWRLALTWRSIVYPFAISLVVAVVFGAYPALRAARLDPIVALRSKY